MSEARVEYESAIDKSYGEFRERVATAYQLMADAADKAWYDYQVSIEHERKVAADNAENRDDSDPHAAGGPEREPASESEQPSSGSDDKSGHGPGPEGSEAGGAAVSGTLPDTRLEATGSASG